MTEVETMTEGEQERLARAKIDRANELRRQHAGRKGIAPADVRLKAEDFDRIDREARAEVEARPTPAATGPPATMPDRIRAACAAFPGSGPVDREELLARMGVLGTAEEKPARKAILNLRQQGKLPRPIPGRPGRKPAGKPSAPRPAVTVAAMAPVPRPSPAPAPGVDVAALARVAAELGRLLDGYDEARRAFAAAYLRERLAGA